MPSSLSRASRREVDFTCVRTFVGKGSRWKGGSNVWSSWWSPLRSTGPVWNAIFVSLVRAIVRKKGLAAARHEPSMLAKSLFK
jgi:hypothetical protein